LTNKQTDEQTTTSTGDKRQVRRLYTVQNQRKWRKSGKNGRGIISQYCPFQHHPKGRRVLGRPKQRWKDQENLQDQVLTGFNIPKPSHDKKGDDDDDDNDGMLDTFLLGKTDYWCKTENVRCTSST
jgi:hypothetical protein